MYATKLDSRHARGIFQYTLDYFVDGFTVELVATDKNKPVLNIYIGGAYVPLKVDFPLKKATWTHLCITWQLGVSSFLSALNQFCFPF